MTLNCLYLTDFTVVAIPTAPPLESLYEIKITIIHFLDTTYLCAKVNLYRILTPSLSPILNHSKYNSNSQSRNLLVVSINSVEDIYEITWSSVQTGKQSQT